MEKKPNEVLNLEEKLKNKKIWINISNNKDNQEALGCSDAAGKRVRLGHYKIPIFCELKSNFGFIIEDNKKKYLLVHYRGNQEIDSEKVKKIIGAAFHRIDPLFNWEEIPGKDSVKLIEFIIQKFGIDCVETVKIDKIDDNRTIRVIAEENTLLLKLNNEKTKMSLKINDVRTQEFVVINENNKLNIYDIEIELREFLGFGLVNPFFGFERPDIMQIFDESLIKQDFIPYTMMTNASHRRWGIEFRPEELINSLPNTLIKDVVTEDTKFKIKKHKIGILTGNSPESGILLWEKINERIRNNFGEYFLGDISFPEVIIESLPEMGLSMELDSRLKDVEEVVCKGITNLCERGASIVCIACNTTQYFSEMAKVICSNFKQKAVYVSIPETTYQYLKRNNINEFDFLGIKYVTNFEKYSAFKNLKKDFDLRVPNDEYLNQINELAFHVKKKAGTDTGLDKLRRLINASTKTNTVILALTELSILFKREKKHKSNKKFYDTLTILAEAIGDLYTEDYLSMMKKSEKHCDAEHSEKERLNR